MRPGPAPLRLLPVLGLTALALAFTACSDSNSTATVTPPDLAFVGSVTIAPNDNPWVPQAAIISCETSVACQILLRIFDGVETKEVLASKDFATSHARVPATGMRPDTDHTIEVVARDADGRTLAATTALDFRTPPLPAWFPPLEIQTAQPQYMEDGVTLLTMLTDAPGCVPALLDAEGNVLWYFDCSTSGLGQEQVTAWPLRNGNLMLLAATSLLVEVNLLGDVVEMFWANGLGGSVPGATSIYTESFHHEIVEMPEGSDSDYAVLGTELRVFADYPADVVDPTQTAPFTNVIGDEIVEFKRDGTVLRRISLFDVLDPYRMVYDSLNNFWDDHYGAPTADWTHANALVLNESTDSWVVSLRHQDCVFQVGRKTGELEWILGDPARWNAPWSNKLLAPVGANFEYQYHQHAPQLLPDGTMMLFDNGNHRAIPPTPQMPFPQSYSRAVQYRVDEITQTVEQVWHYGGPPGGTEPSFFSFFVSSAFRQPSTGNVLICDGGKGGPGGSIWGRVLEITTEPTPQVVFECSVQADGVTNMEDYFMYRAYRLSGVYR